MIRGIVLLVGILMMSLISVMGSREVRAQPGTGDLGGGGNKCDDKCRERMYFYMVINKQCIRHAYPTCTFCWGPQSLCVKQESDSYTGSNCTWPNANDNILYISDTSCDPLCPTALMQSVESSASSGGESTALAKDRGRCLP